MISDAFVTPLWPGCAEPQGWMRRSVSLTEVLATHATGRKQEKGKIEKSRCAPNQGRMINHATLHPMVTLSTKPEACEMAHVLGPCMFACSLLDACTENGPCPSVIGVRVFLIRCPHRQAYSLFLELSEPAQIVRLGWFGGWCQTSGGRKNVQEKLPFRKTSGCLQRSF